MNTSHAQYQVEGIGYDFVPGKLNSTVSLIPDVLNRSLVDTWIKTGDQESFTMSRRLIRTEGLLCGGSAGAAVVGAVKVAKQMNLGKDKIVVVILPDSLRNYITKVISHTGWRLIYSFLMTIGCRNTIFYPTFQTLDLKRDKLKLGKKLRFEIYIFQRLYLSPKLLPVVKLWQKCKKEDSINSPWSTTKAHFVAS